MLGAPLLLAAPRLVTAAPPDAYATLLAEEHAAIYLYGVLAPHLPDALRDAARAAYDDHRGHRDLLADAIRAAGGTPPPARATYALPSGVGTAAAAKALAIRIEDSLALRWHEAVRSVPPRDRARAATALGDECEHLVRLRAGSSLPEIAPPFPGR